MSSVPTDQAWFFTPERLAGKRQADDEIAMGIGTVHDSGEAMFAAPRQPRRCGILMATFETLPRFEADWGTPNA